MPGTAPTTEQTDVDGPGVRIFNSASERFFDGGDGLPSYISGFLAADLGIPTGRWIGPHQPNLYRYPDEEWIR